MNKRTSMFAVAAMMAAFAGNQAMAADLAPPPPPAPEIRPAMNDWTGPYIGAVLGGTCMESEMHAIVETTPPSTFGPLTNNGCGISGGLIGGFNYQINNILLGLEGDWTWSTDTGDGRNYLVGTMPPYYQHDIFDPDWQASVRLRLGILSTEKTLFYVTGGVSWMKAKLTAKVEGPTTVSGSDTATHRGYILGGGMEHALTENIHLRAEYLYASYNAKNYGPYTPPPPNPAVSARYKPEDVHTFRAGVSWNFPVSSW